MEDRRRKLTDTDLEMPVPGLGAFQQEFLTNLRRLLIASVTDRGLVDRMS